ncbi:hypothetical protein AB838_05005 [Rhodobacteraceae bacterium (ex Bugula neritina AB1)]|nr:hypothetical protein AB838_05005 [Rhodobacteraceae bacterium (ex Bugula neritina AB1)]
MSDNTLYFPVDKALEAMGNTSRRWQNHLETNKIHVPAEVNFVSSFGPGRGKHRHISIEAITQGAIAFALIDCGVEVRSAYLAGAEFAFLGELGGAYGYDESAPLDPVLDRMPGRLYAEGETFLIYSVGEVEPHNKRLTFVSDRNPVFAAKRGISAPAMVVHAVDGGSSAAPRIVLNVSQLCRRIASSLGICFTAAFMTEAG